MICPGKTRRIKTIAFLMATVMVMVSLGVNENVWAGQDALSVFKASFSGLKDGTILTDDTVTVAALEKNFYIYNYQRAQKNRQASYFERNEVNGYLVEGDSESEKPRFPDTGAIPGKDLDGYGSAKDKPIPLWSIDNGWLSCNAYNGTDAFLFRQGNLLYVKDNTVSGFAAIKNFQLDMGFKFSTTAENDALAVIFHAKEAGKVLDPNQCVLAFNAEGKMYYGKTKDYETGISYNNKLAATNGGVVKFKTDHAYTLSLTVLGRSLDLSIKDGKTVIATYRDVALPITDYENGYFAIGLSNNGPAIADIQVQKLDDTGAAADFNDPVAGYPFGFVASTLSDYRSYYFARIGDGGANRNPAAWYFRKNSNLYWYDFSSTRRESNDVWLGEGSTAVNDKIDSLFATYHEQISTKDGKRLFGKADHFSYRVADWGELNLGDGQVDAGGWLIARKYLVMRQSEQAANRMLSQVTTIAPKTTSGDQIITKNFETTFGAYLDSNPETAIALSFRSSSPSAMINKDGTAGYADKVTVVISGAGYKILDGEALGLSGNALLPWNGGATFAGNARVTIKAIGNKLTLKVTNDDNVVYLDNSSEPFVLSTDRVGYIYYSALHCSGHLSDLGLTRLNDNGDRADVDANPNIEIVRTDYEAVSIEINRANGQSLADAVLPSEISGVTKDGDTFFIPLEWSSEEYRSYKQGSFKFLATPASGGVMFSAGIQPVATVINNIGDDYDTTTSRKYYFDSTNDLNDFVCHNSSPVLSSDAELYDVKMTKVNPLDYWNITGGRVRSTYSRTFNAGWNGLSRASDVSTMVLADDDMALINYKLEIDYQHGTDWWYPYVLYGVQNPAQFFAKVTQGDLTTGSGTSLAFDNQTKRGGVYTYLEVEGRVNFWGAIQGGQDGYVLYDKDIADGQNFLKTYDRNAMHHMTVTVLNGTVGVQIDNSEIYYADLDDAALGGYVGFASCGNGVSFSNLQITALDESGKPMSISNAKKAVAPKLVPDTYSGWLPFEKDWQFDWKTPYTFD